MSKFPRVKLNEADEGETQMVITVDGDCVVIAFPQPTAWLAFPAEQAEELARILVERAQDAKRNRLMTGLELDREVRRILSTVTRETSLSAAMALYKLGFGAMAAWHMVCLYLDAKEAAAHDDA